MSVLLWQTERLSLGPSGEGRLEDISVSIPLGITAIIGASGAGKTSLIQILVGFTQPDSGSVKRVPESADGRIPWYWAPQNGGLWPHISVQGHIEKSAWAGYSDHDLEEIFERTGLSALKASFPSELSSGEQARLNTARGLAAGAGVLVLDEPFAHADENIASECWQLILDFAERFSFSVLFTSHRPQTVIGRAEHVICLDRGDLLYAGSVEVLYNSPPDHKTAACLGEFNWIDSESQASWGIAGTKPDNECVRPERFVIESDENGTAEVQTAVFKGSVEEVILRRRPDGELKTFVHRPVSAGLKQGMSVALRILSVLLLVLFTGCTGSDIPQLPVEKQRYLSMPPEGSILPAPRAVCPGKDGSLLVLDTIGRVLNIRMDGSVIRKWYMPEYDVGRPEGICLLRDGRIAVADTHYNRVVLFNSDGSVESMFGSKGTGQGEFLYPVGVVEDPAGNLYVCEYGSNDRIQKFSPDREFLISFGSFGTEGTQFQRCSGMVWHKGMLYIADAINNRIQVFSDEGVHKGTYGLEKPGLRLPYDITLSGDLLYTAEYGSGRISAFSLSGMYIGSYGTSGGGSGELRTPWGLTSLKDGTLVIADTGNRRLVVLSL